MFFLDSSEPNEIRELFAWGVLSGVTTNPLILSREAATADLETRIREVIAASSGPVSVELTSEDEAGMMAEAARYPRVGSRARVHQGAVRRARAPRHPRALEARRHDERDLHHVLQPGLLAALAGGTYVSIFSGRVRDMGYDVRPVIADTRAQIDREELDARIIVGSVRHFMDVNEALGAGAHIVNDAARHPPQDAPQPEDRRDHPRVQPRLAKPWKVAPSITRPTAAPHRAGERRA